MITCQRSTLSVPGHLKKMHEKALSIAPDVIMFDLEDSVPLELKQEARKQIALSLTSLDISKKNISVRVNSTDTPYCFRDVIEIMQAAGTKIDSIVLPKVNSAGDIHFLARLLDGIEAEMETKHSVAIDASIESAEGAQNISEIAAAPRVRSLIFGIADYSSSVGVRLSSISGHGENENLGNRWNYIMSMIVQAARVNNLLAIDAPYGDFSDLTSLRASAQTSLSLGFDGKWAIHPSQVEIINEVFSPTTEEIERANRIIKIAKDTPNRGAVAIDGKMVDRATIRLANRLLDMAKLGKE